jgi:hypothetical protein
VKKLAAASVIVPIALAGIGYALVAWIIRELDSIYSMNEATNTEFDWDWYDWHDDDDWDVL